MILKPGEKIHVITRRMFEGDVRRHFAGEVKDANERTARLEGYVYVFDSGRNEFIRKDNPRVKLVAIGDCGYVMNIIPENVILEDLEYIHTDDNRLVVTDGKEFSLDINEFGANR